MIMVNVFNTLLLTLLSLLLNGIFWVSRESSDLQSTNYLTASGGVEVEIPSDDISLYGVLYRPEDVPKDTKLPAVVIIHGWAPYHTRPVDEYTFVAKEYAHAGYISLAIGMRGWAPTGGSDDCGLQQPHDIINAAKWLSKQAGVDSDRIALRGQSLGGQVALSAAALDPIIKATAAYFPITDFRLWGVTTAFEGIKEDYIYGICARKGSPEDRSPLYSSENITGAVLLLHGDKDNNVVLTHSMLMYQKMLEHQQDVTLFIAKGGGHGSGGPGWERHNDIVLNFFKDKMP